MAVTGRKHRGHQNIIYFPHIKMSLGNTKCLSLLLSHIFYYLHVYYTLRSTIIYSKLTIFYRIGSIESMTNNSWEHCNNNYNNITNLKRQYLPTSQTIKDESVSEPLPVVK